MKISRNYERKEDWIVRYAVASLEREGKDAQWVLDHYREPLSTISKRNPQSYFKNAEIRKHLRGEDPLLPIAEAFLEEQFIHPFPKSIGGIKTFVSRDILALYIATAGRDEAIKSPKIIAEVAKSNKSSLLAHMNGYMSYIRNIESDDMDDIKELAIINPISLKFISESCTLTEHWSIAMASNAGAMQYAPANKIDEVVFRSILRSNDHALSYFLKNKTKKLSDIKGLNNKDMASICLSQKFDISRCFDFFSKDQVISIISKNPGSFGDCEFIGRDFEIDMIALAASSSVPGALGARVAKKCSTRTLEAFIGSFPSADCFYIQKEISSRGLISTSISKIIPQKKLSRVSMSSMDELFSVDNERDEIAREESVLIEEARIKIKEMGVTEDFMIKNFTHNLKRIQLDIDMGNISDSYSIRKSINGEDPLVPAAEMIIRKMLEGFSSDLCGIPRILPAEFVGKMCAFDENNYYNITNSGRIELFKNSVFEFASRQDNYTLSAHRHGFYSKLREIGSATDIEVFESIIANSNCINYFKPSIVSQENYNHALSFGVVDNCLMEPENIDPVVFHGVIGRNLPHMSPVLPIDAADIDKIRGVDRNKVIHAHIKGMSNISVGSYFTEEEVAFIASINPRATVSKEDINAYESIAKAVLECSFYKSSFDSFTLHSSVVGMLNQGMAEKMDALGLINYKLLNTEMANLFEGDIAKKINKMSRARSVAEASFEDIPF